MLVDRGRSTERFVLLDLGVASKTDSLTTLRNKALDGAMSPQYASPEQVQSKEVNFHSDVYSLGTILYEWLTGKPPFQSEQLLGLVNAIANLEPAYPSEVTDREIHPDVEAVVLQCLHKNPTRRPESVDEVRRRILQAMAPEALSDTGVSGLPAVTRQADTEAISNPSAQTLNPPTTVSEDAIATDKNPPSQRQAPTWQGSSEQTKTTHSSSGSSWWKYAVGLGGFCLATVAITFLLPTPAAVQITLPPVVEVPAGNQITTAATIVGEPSELILEFEVADAPDWLTVEVPPESISASSATIRMTAQLVAEAADADITLIVHDGDTKIQQTMTVRLLPPTVWVPEGFTAVGNSLVDVRAKDVVVPSIINKRIGDDDVRFLLITPENRRTPFYVMENKVWNKLLLAYADKTEKLPSIPENSRDGWRMGAMTLDGELEEPIGIIGPDVARLPVMNLTAFQAHELAQWLGGASAHLPSATEWDVAAGLESRTSKSLDEAYSVGPYRRTSNRPDVAVKCRNGPRAVGESKDDVSPFGCRDMAGNGEELTRSTDSGQDVPRCAKQANVYTRGRDYADPVPLTWDDLDLAHRPGTASTIPADTPDPKIGFRIVIDIEPDTKKD